MPPPSHGHTACSIRYNCSLLSLTITTSAIFSNDAGKDQKYIRDICCVC